MPSVRPIAGAPVVVRDQSVELSLPTVEPVAAGKALVTVEKRRVRPTKSKRLRRLMMPYCLAAGLAGSALGGGVGAVALSAGWLAALPSYAISRTATVATDPRAQHLATVRADYRALSHDAVRTMRRQATAAEKAGIAFASEPAPLTSLSRGNRDHARYLSVPADQVARELAHSGRIYVGILGDRLSFGTVVESPSAKAIASIAELQTFLAKF